MTIYFIYKKLIFPQDQNRESAKCTIKNRNQYRETFITPCL